MSRASQDHQTINIDNSIPTVNKSIYLMHNIKIFNNITVDFHVSIQEDHRRELPKSLKMN